MKKILIIAILVLVIVAATIILVNESAQRQKFVAVKVFFNNSKMDPEFSCNKVFPVERTVLKSGNEKEEAVSELLQGPTEQEAEQGYFTSINSGVKTENLSVNGDTVNIAFDESLEEAVGGSCRVAAIRAQIEQTLKQFSGIKNVVISINGRTEDILQP